MTKPDPDGTMLVGRTVRRFVAASMVLIGSLISVNVLAPVAAVADPATVRTETDTVTFTFQQPILLCTAGSPVYDFTETVTFVDRVVSNSTSVHDFSTLTYSFTATPVDPSLPTATGEGKGTVAFEWIVPGAGVETNPFDQTVNFSNGTTVTEHVVFHFTITPDYQVYITYQQCHAR
jgi:hypothetical protein